jgi:hypothetical protein
MDGQNSQILKSVLNQVPTGFLADTRWLTAQGVSRSSAYDYNREGWLERVAHGVYRRPAPHNEKAVSRDWRVAVLSAQHIMRYDFHVGGMTALTLDGSNHYVALGRSSRVYLYGNVPRWLTKLPVDAKFQPRRRQLFGSDPIGVDNRDVLSGMREAANPWVWPLVRSTPERAILEALNELPDDESFHVVDMVFEGLTNLRPQRLEKLLTLCKSKKVKRLFLLFADRHGHAWLRHIDRSKINLGTGPRALVEGGRYMPAYQLMVPAEFANPRIKAVP